MDKNSDSSLSHTKNCRMCGKIFSHPHNTICHECLIKDEEDFQKVRLFLKEFPGSKANTVEKYTGVSRKKILKYLREERLEITENSTDFADFLKCAKCGKPIPTGVYCSECYLAFTKEINTLFSNEKDNVTPKMHIKINRKNNI